MEQLGKNHFKNENCGALFVQSTFSAIQEHCTLSAGQAHFSKSEASLSLSAIFTIMCLAGLLELKHGLSFGMAHLLTATFVNLITGDKDPCVRARAYSIFEIGGRDETELLAVGMNRQEAGSDEKSNKIVQFVAIFRVYRDIPIWIPNMQEYPN